MRWIVASLHVAYHKQTLKYRVRRTKYSLNMCDQNTASTQSIADYLAQLLKDRKQLAAFPNVFIHVERLLDEGKRFVSVPGAHLRRRRHHSVVGFRFPQPATELQVISLTCDRIVTYIVDLNGVRLLVCFLRLLGARFKSKTSQHLGHERVFVEINF